MTDIVPAYKIEQIVGVVRHPRLHYGRAVSSERTVYILHSQNCRESNPDLRDCEFSVALDAGIDEELWSSRMDIAVPLSVVGGKLWPGVAAWQGGTEL